MNKRHYEHTLPNIRGSLSNTYVVSIPVFFLVVNFPWFEPLRTLMPGLEFSSNQDWKSGRQKQVKRLRILWNTQISDLRKAAVKSVPDWHSGICDSDRPVDSRRKSMPVMSTVCEA